VLQNVCKTLLVRAHQPFDPNAATNARVQRRQAAAAGELRPQSSISVIRTASIRGKFAERVDARARDVDSRRLAATMVCISDYTSCAADVCALRPPAPSAAGLMPRPSPVGGRRHTLGKPAVSLRVGSDRVASLIDGLRATWFA
jgi:hypothetical protein